MFEFNLAFSGVEIWYPGLVLLGLAIGILTGIFGVGGGFLLTPCLNIFFGIPYPIAIGSSLVQIFITGSVSVWKYWVRKNVDFSLGIIMAVGALCGTEIGVRLLHFLDNGQAVVINGHVISLSNLVLNLIYIGLMVVLALLMWRETAMSVAKGDEEVASALAYNLQQFKLPPLIAFPRSGIHSLCLWVPFGLSIFVGILTGMLGIGGGFINFPILIYVLGIPTNMAVGTSAFQILFATGYGAIRHALQQHVEFGLVGWLLLGSITGVQIGVYLSKFLGGRKIRRYFVWVIMAGIIVIAVDLFNKLW